MLADRKKSRLILGGMMGLCVLLIFGVCLLFLRIPEQDRYELEKARVILNGEEVEIDTGVLEEDETGVTLVSEVSTFALNSLPIYFDNENALVVTEDMLLYCPTVEAVPYKVETFSRLRDWNDMIEVSNASGKYSIKGGVLFDGKDLYIFLEPVTLNFRGKKMELGTLSFVRLVRDNCLEAYDHRTGSSYYTRIGDATAQVEAGGITIDVGTDSYTSSSGGTSILFTDPELFTTHKNEE